MSTALSPNQAPTDHSSSCPAGLHPRTDTACHLMLYRNEGPCKNHRLRGVVGGGGGGEGGNATKKNTELSRLEQGLGAKRA